MGHQPAPLPLIDLVVLKVVSPCNLDCTYCYVYNGNDQSYRRRPARLTEDMADAVVRRLAAYCDARPGHRMSICLHGGEPLLLGRPGFARLVEQLRAGLGGRLGTLAVQTNAVLVDEEWARLLRELRVAVSVSLDGTPEQHDAVRVDHQGRGSYDRVVAGIKQLVAAGVDVSVLCVARPGTSGADAYRSLRALGLKSLDFLLPDVSHDDLTRVYGGLGPTPVADYLVSALHAWLAEDDPAIDLRLFSDMLRLVMGAPASTDAFGGPMPYLVIETDGAIQANDALRVCEEGMNDTGLSVLDNSLDDLDAVEGVARDLIAGALPLPSACTGCPEAETCRGGYMPHRYSRAAGFDNPSVWCADLLRLFSEMRALTEAPA